MSDHDLQPRLLWGRRFSPRGYRRKTTPQFRIRTNPQCNCLPLRHSLKVVSDIRYRRVHRTAKMDLVLQRKQQDSEKEEKAAPRRHAAIRHRQPRSVGLFIHPSRAQGPVSGVSRRTGYRARADLRPFHAAAAQVSRAGNRVCEFQQCGCAADRRSSPRVSNR
jgi:hypothetical protein